MKTKNNNFSNSTLSPLSARYYHSAHSFWLSVDPLADKYPNLSPYTYCAGNPVVIIDPSGDSCAVLLAKNAVKGMGHMAVLVQNEKGKWELWSKNGDDDGQHKTFSGKERGTKDDEGYIGNEIFGFSSVADFLNDTQANTEKHDGVGDTYYTDAYVLPTTRTQDAKIIASMKKKLDENYHLTGSNCAQAVSYALESAGVRTKGNRNFFTLLGEALCGSQTPYTFVKHASDNIIPRTMFKHIVRANDNRPTIKRSVP